MCGRYTYFSSEEILKEFDFLKPDDPQARLALDLPDNYNVSPGSDMPVIIRGEQAHRIEFMNWGLIPFWSKGKDSPVKLINAKEEALIEKPTWKRLVQKNRCIVPARGFYEWKTIDGKKVPFYITPKNGHIFSFAGLYDEFDGPNGKEYSYVIITTSPNKEMSDVHTRMPAVLNKQQMDMWLEPGEVTRSQLDDLLGTPPDNTLNVIQVSTMVNNARNNSEDLIYPLDD